MVEDFKSLLATTKEGYIGHGNPNAKILFLGQEPNWNTEDPEQKTQYQIEIKNNSEDWKQIVLRGDDYGLIDSYVANFDLKRQKPEFFSPLNPWPLQKYQVLTWKTVVEVTPSGQEIKKRVVAKGKDGTARTWHKYQTLINLIFGESLSRNERLTFHRKSFHTDMSDAAYKEHNSWRKDSKDSVNARTEMLSHQFFRKFPIIIAQVGNFPKYSSKLGDSYFHEVFGTTFFPDESYSKHPWINVNIREDENPQLLIHCWQFAARFPNTYLEQIAKIVRDFATKHNIDLTPSE